MSGFNQKNDVSKGRLFFVYLQQFRCFLVCYAGFLSGEYLISSAKA